MRENNVLFDLGIVLFDFLCYTLHEVKAMNQARRIFLENIPSECMFCGVSGLTQKWDEGDGWSFIGNPRPSHGLMLIVCHHAEIRVWDGGRLTARRGDMLYIPEGMEYDIHFYGSSGDITDVQVNFRMLEPGGALCFGSEISCFLSDTPQQIFRVMLRIADTSLQQKCPTLRVTKLFYGLLESVLAYWQLGDKQARKSGIAPALLYIDSHVGDRIRVSDLAKMSLMSESAFRKAFRRSPRPKDASRARRSRGSSLSRAARAESAQIRPQWRAPPHRQALPVHSPRQRAPHRARRCRSAVC